MLASRSIVEDRLASGAVVYGITTGFGRLANIVVRPEQALELQRNLLRSHAAGVGPPAPREVVRAMLLLRAATLARGHSGVRPCIVDALCDLLAANVTPHVPLRGSVGASGDLAPLAHLALVLIGEGEAFVGDRRLPGAAALAEAKLQPLVLQPKEGLALLNGTQFMSGFGVLALHRAEQLAATADVIGAMTLEATRGSAGAFDSELLATRPHPGQRDVGRALRRLLANSALADSHRDSHHRVQDPYSLRCMPQVHGATRDALSFLRSVLEIEVNSVTDNPLVFAASAKAPGGRIVSGGNFHGQPVATALDAARIGLAALAAISERRTALLMDSDHSDGLTPFLGGRPGLDSGYMVLQYTAAALVNELQTMAHPSSINSIPTSANQEDHVSMGATSAVYLWEVVDRVEHVLAIEAVCAARGLDLREPAAPSHPIAAAHKLVRQRVPPLDEDRPPSTDVTAVLPLIRDGQLVREAFQAAPHAE